MKQDTNPSSPTYVCDSPPESYVSVIDGSYWLSLSLGDSSELLQPYFLATMGVFHSLYPAWTVGTPQNDYSRCTDLGTQQSGSGNPP